MGATINLTKTNVLLGVGAATAPIIYSNSSQLGSTDLHDSKYRCGPTLSNTLVTQDPAL